MYRHPGLKIDIEDKSGPSPIIKNSHKKDEPIMRGNTKPIFYDPTRVYDSTDEDEPVIARGKTKPTFYDSAGVYVSDRVDIRDSAVVKPFFKEDNNNGSDNNDGNKEG